ncbi:hypothetical protein MPSEU_001048300 [Mayamaea pseudoterrestris]|nr:hypothetical protein MPSEU_001048300 [Mayamaea pseudoterrestris]
MANVSAVSATATQPSEGFVAVPEESELCLLCLDYLRDLRRSYPPQTLRSVEGLHADYLTVACWALSRAFAAPEQLTAVHGNDPFLDSANIASLAGDIDLNSGGPIVLSSLRSMEDELISKENLPSEDADQKKDDDDVFNLYEYDDAHASNSHRFFTLSGMASGQSLSGPLTLGELVAAGLSGLGARSRLDAERAMIQSPMFQQFVQAVKERGFFSEDDLAAGQDQGKLYEQRFRKVAAKFRTKLANKAQAEGVGDWNAAMAAEYQRQQRKLKLQAVMGRMDLPGIETQSDLMLEVTDLPTPTSYRTRKQFELSPVASRKDATSDGASVSEILTSENPHDADEAERYKNQGNGHMQRKEYTLAAECYTKALKISPTGANSHVYFSNRAAALVSMKMFQEAILDSERSLALKPDYGKAHARLGLTHFLLGNYRQAMEAYTVALKYEPDNKGSKAYLEKSAKRLAEVGEATAINSEPSFSIVSEWEKTSTNKLAIKTEHDDHSKSGDERDAEKYKAKGNALMASREYELSVAAYTKAIALSSNGPQSHVYYSNRAAALCYLERYLEAEEDSLKSLSLNPSYGKAHARLGLSRFFMHDYAGAIEAYDAALQHDPENAASKSYLAKAKVKLAALQTEQAAKREAEDQEARQLTSKVMAKSSEELTGDPDM